MGSVPVGDSDDHELLASGSCAPVLRGGPESSKSKSIKKCIGVLKDQFLPYYEATFHCPTLP